jgi:hypothetical protein
LMSAAMRRRASQGEAVGWGEAAVAVIL